MLARISGILEQVEGTRALVCLPGAHEGTAIAHEVLLPAYLGERLTDKIGMIVTFHTIEYLEAQSQGSSFVPRLIGFGSERERRFFELFTTVKGVGAKKALRALALAPGQVARAIAERDTSALIGLPEIGKRLADTMIAELRGKVELFIDAAEAGVDRPASQIEPGRMHSEPARRAVAALVRLGESERQAEDLIRRTLDQDGAPCSADELVAAALAHR